MIVKPSFLDSSTSPLVKQNISIGKTVLLINQPLYCWMLLMQYLYAIVGLNIWKDQTHKSNAHGLCRWFIVGCLAGCHLLPADLCPRLGAPQPGGVQGGRECPAGPAAAGGCYSWGTTQPGHLLPQAGLLPADYCKLWNELKGVLHFYKDVKIDQNDEVASSPVRVFLAGWGAGGLHTAEGPGAHRAPGVHTQRSRQFCHWPRNWICEFILNLHAWECFKIWNFHICFLKIIFKWEAFLYF